MSKKRKYDGTAPDMGALERERNDLLVSGKEPVRLQKVKEILDYLHFGITPNKNKTK